MTISRPEFTKQDLLISIERAVSAERERCAAIAHDWAFECRMSGWNDGWASARGVANRIKKVEGGPTAAVRPTPINAINQPKPASGEEELK